MNKSTNKFYIPLTFVIAVSFLVCICLFVAITLFKPDKPQIVSFDMKATVNLFLSQLQSNDLSEEKINDITQKFNTVLDDSIKSYSHNHNVLILVKPAVVYGADDVTEDIQKLISEKMAN